jgi:hypothetical protein
MEQPERSAPIGPMSCIELAAAYQVDAELLRRNLNQFRRMHPEGAAWIQIPAPNPNRPKFLYNVRAVQPIIRELLARRRG